MKASRILDLGTRWKRVASFTLRPLYPQRKSPWYPLDRRLQSRYGHGGEQKNSQPLPGLEHPIIQPVAQSYTENVKSCRPLIVEKRGNWYPSNVTVLVE
jgi:hypothetical protein